MSKRRSARRANRQQQKQQPQQPRTGASASPATAKPEPKTVADVVAAISLEEIEALKAEYERQQLEKDEEASSRREAVEREIAEGREATAQLEARRASLAQEIEELEKKLSETRKSLSDAEEAIATAEQEAQSIRDDADSYAESAREGADEQAMNMLAEATQKAKAAWKTQIEDIERQLQEIAALESRLAGEQRELAREKRMVDFKREELQEMQEDLETQRARYVDASPSKVAALEIALSDRERMYDSLLERHKDLSKRFAELQSFLDSIRVEVGDEDAGARQVSIGELMSEVRELRSRHDKLKSIYERYPDDARIAGLETRARRVDELLVQVESLIVERDRYRDESVAARIAGRELESIKREAEATQALNQHLLEELESHKTALESRTGDKCPELTRVDTETKTPEFVRDLSVRAQHRELASLPEIVQHVRNYAGSQPGSKQLFYTANDIRAFLAGMAVSHLVILQGMSGTGKSSLPRIFSEAVLGFNYLVPVESSWRDSNELLGYYNDFNKKFNAKRFTVELYRSSKECMREFPVFITLDEMNLARIEYYFADFLAVLEVPDESNWLVELVHQDMRTLPDGLPKSLEDDMERENPSLFDIWDRIRRAKAGESSARTTEEERERLNDYLARANMLTGAEDLVEGRKIRITPNVWFIGTANRDESTFEITDKVYDRAQIVSLNRKGVNEGPYKAAAPMYLSTSNLFEMFDEAVRGSNDRQKVLERLQTLDEVLMSEFDTSFGNRILTQAVDFVAVFVAAGGDLDDALDYQISTKIVRKIINTDNRDALELLLDYVEDYKETARIITRRINELDHSL